MPKKIKVVDVLEELNDAAVTDTDWNASEFFQDILEVCLMHKNKVAKDCLVRLGQMIEATA